MSRPLALAVTVLMALATVVNLVLGGPNWVAFLAIAIAAVTTTFMLQTDPGVGDRPDD